MALPSETKSLNSEQLVELSRSLSGMRHDINNSLSLIIAAVEIIRRKPQMAENMLATIGEQPGKITKSVARFSAEMERVLELPRVRASEHKS
jgi:hypothetical protein